MRVTVDLDSRSKWKLLVCIIKGTLLCRKLPFKVRKTLRGYHIVWRGLKIDQEKMFEYRRKLGDDPKRLELDMKTGKKIKQVLFSEKITTYNGVFPTKNGFVTRCPECNKEIEKTVVFWLEDKKMVEVHHKDKTICILPLNRIG